jgi:hypothetical protein
MFDNELSTLKTLSLESYALTLGYARDPKESNARVVVLRRESDNGKLLVKQGHDGHYIFRNERDLSQGTIIDLTMKELGVNLGEARKALREWAGFSLHPAQTPSGSSGISVSPTPGKAGHSENVPSCPADDEPDRARMNAIWNRATWVPEHPYLLARHIPKNILNDARIKDRFRLDAHGNAVFPSWDKGGLCGLEFRSPTQKSFAKGGKKGLWVSRNIKTCLRLVVTESAIDAMSHLALFRDATDALLPFGYAAVGGSLGERSKALLVHLFEQASQRGAEILIGTDNDAAGHEYAAMIAALSPVAERITPIGNDWADDLAWCVREDGGAGWN